MKEDCILATFVLVSFIRRHQLKQVNVAPAMGLTDSAMSRLCNYGRNLSFTEVVSFCHFANVDIADFVGSYQSLVQDKSRRKKVLATVRALSAQSEYDNLLDTLQS